MKNASEGSFNPESEINSQEVYEKFKKKKTAEKHLLSRGRERKKMKVFSEESEETKNQFENFGKNNNDIEKILEMGMELDAKISIKKAEKAEKGKVKKTASGEGKEESEIKIKKKAPKTGKKVSEVIKGLVLAFEKGRDEEILKFLGEEENKDIITAIMEERSDEEKETERGFEEAAKRNLLAYMIKRKYLMKLLADSVKNLDEFRKEVFKKEISEFSGDVYSKIDEAKERQNKIADYLENILPYQNPESFRAHNFLKLKEYKKQLSSGIVETEYAKELIERGKNLLRENRVFAFLGETGGGKTMAARKIAESFSPDYEFVAGHSFMTKEDLFSYLGVDVHKMKAEDAPGLIEEAKKKYFEKPECEYLTDEEKRRDEKLIEDVLKQQAGSLEMVTKVFKAAMLKGAAHGRTVVVDEFNYIPNNLLGGANALIEAKSGQKINVFGEEITVKEGFGVIFTGNITLSEAKERYLERKTTDAAFLGRLRDGIIMYNFLPQNTDLSFENSILETEDIETGGKIPERQLFEVALGIVTGKGGVLSGPRDTLEMTWNVSGALALLQALYSGDEQTKSVKLPKGQSYQLKKFPISNRTVRAVLEGWKKGGFNYLLDWYLFENIIRPAYAAGLPTEAAQIFILLKEARGFFRDPAWGKITVDDATFKITGINEIDKDRKNFQRSLRRFKEEEQKDAGDEKEKKESTYFFSDDEIAEAMAGRKAPEFKAEDYGAEKTEDVKTAEKEREREKIIEDWEEKIEEMEGLFDGWDKTMELFCEDEANIMAEAS